MQEQNLLNMNRKHIPELGKQYGNFTIISEEIGRSNDQKILFKVKCSCGKEQFVRAYFLELAIIPKNRKASRDDRLK